MKKLLFTLAFVLAALGASAQTFTVSGLTYKVTDSDAKTVAVTYFNGTNNSGNASGYTGAMVIPSTVSNSGVTYSVTSIADYAFENATITAVTIPSSVSTIGYYAFRYTNQLTKITIADATTALSFVTGYNTSFGSSDKEVYIGRDINRTGDYAGEPMFSKVTKATFGPKVTTIPNNFMSGQDYLATLIIGDGVKTIGNDAFKSVRYAEPQMSVTMGANVETIGDRAFQGCLTLKSITLPSKLKTIGEYAFESSGLTAITIPASVTDINYYAFRYCGSLASIAFEDSDTPVNFVTGYNRSFGGTAKEVYIGRDVNRTGDYTGERMFDNVTKATFGDKVTTIPNNFLSGQDYMTTLTIGKGVKTIGNDAFKGVRYADPGLTVTMGPNVESIGDRAFQNCPVMTAITLPSKLKTIGAYAFEYCGLTAITIPTSVTDINYYAFLNCGSLASITFEDSDTPVNFVTGYSRSFGGTAKEVYIGRNVNRTGDYAGERMFDNVTKLTVSNKVTEISGTMFDGNNQLATVTIGSGVKTIGAYAFRNCGKADYMDEMKVTMGANVDSLGVGAFQSFTQLKSISIPSKLAVIPNYAFEGCGLTTLTIPATLTHIGYYTFRSCNNLTKITIADSTTPVNFVTGYDRSFGSAEKEVYLGRNVNRIGDYPNNRMFDKVNKLTVGNKVTEIARNLFDSNTELATITIGSGVKNIGYCAFYNCGNAEDIETMTVTMGANVETLSESAFNNCTKLKSITLPSTLTTIGAYAFQSTALTAISIPASVTDINYYAFHNSNALASIRFEESTTPVNFVTGYDRSFGNTAKEVYMGRNINRTGDYSTNRLFNNLTKLTVGNKVTEIGRNMFDSNTELATVTIGSSVKTIGYCAFYNCGNAEGIETMTVTMGANVETLGESAFNNCKTLKSITLPATLTIIGAYAFQSTALAAISIPASVTDINYYAFRNCNALTNIRFEDSDTPVNFVTGYDTSFGTSAKQVYMGRDFNRTGDYKGNRPFNKVTEVTFGPKVTEIGASMFNGSELTDVHAPWMTPIATTENVFSNAAYQNATLWVPGGTKEAYQTANVWKKFQNMDFGSFVVSVNATKGGKLTLGDITVTNGQTKTTLIDRGSDAVLTVAANNGYQLSSLKVNGSAVAVTNNTYTLKNVQAEQNVVATFAPINYTISYTLNGGSVSTANPTSYNIETATFTLNNPTRSHYVFTGWTGTDLAAATKTVTVKKGSTGNRSYTANWDKETYTVTIEGGGITADNYSPKYGESVVLTIVDDPDLQLTSLKVNGTDVTSQVVNNKYTIKNVSENITVVGLFKSTKEFITMQTSLQTFSCTEDLDFSNVSGLKAYVAGGFDKSTNRVLFMSAEKVPAGTGLLLAGTAGTTYKVPYETVSTYYVNLLKAQTTSGTIGKTEGSMTNYVFDATLNNFKLVESQTALTAKSAYLQVPTSFAGARTLTFVFSDNITTRIEDFELFTPAASEGIYNLGGQRVKNAGHGIYIQNGKKVVK